MRKVPASVRATSLVLMMALTGIAWAGLNQANGFDVTERNIQRSTAGAAPHISDIPGIILVGSSFPITGSGFTTGSVVNFFVATSSGAVNAGPLKPIFHAATTLTIDVPPATILGQGFVAVQVVNADQGFAASNLAYALLQGSAAAGIPTIKTIDGKGLAVTSGNPGFATNNVETVVKQGSVVALGGSGFDTVNGVAIDLFCACPHGKVGPFLLGPGDPGLSPALVSFNLPMVGLAGSPAIGPGSFVISNKGGDGTYGGKSNAVSVPIGASITVISVVQSGARIQVMGTGFSSLTVINFFNTRPAGMVNLAGNKADGSPRIPLMLMSDRSFSFSIPAGAVPGPSYVQALNPPFVPFTSSGNAAGGVFVLAATPTPKPTAAPTPRPTASHTSTSTPKPTTARPTPTATMAPATVTGTVESGLHPIVGATVTLYRSGTTGYGSTPLALGRAVSAANGRFTIGFAPPSGAALWYLVASGGNAGAGSNGASVLMALWSLPSRLNIRATPVVIDELSTIASVWGLAQFINPAIAQDIGAPAGNITGIGNATATVLGNLINSSSSTTPGHDLPPKATAPVAKLNTLANLLAACVDSPGLSSGACEGLFSAATARGAKPPASTLAAALAIAIHPGNKVAALFDLARAATAYEPSLTAAPTDWTLAISYKPAGLDEPTGAAVDKAGNVWIANYGPAVVKLGPTGHTLSPAAGFKGGGLEESFAIAVDAAGNVWVTNEQSPAGVNSGLGTVTKLAPNGAVLSGAAGFADGGLDFAQTIAIDNSGNAWIANFGNSTVTKLDSKGIPLSPAAGFAGGGLNFPVGIAIDAAGDAWIANQSNNSVTELASNGAARSGPAGFRGGGLKEPAALAIDRHGNVWIANFSTSSLTELAPDGMPLSPGGGFLGGGLEFPGAIAVDGAGNLWVTNFHGASLSEIAGADSGSPGHPLSPSSGFTDLSLSEPYAPAIDAAGNLWTANFGNNSVTEFIGLAAPVRTPQIGPPQRP